MTGFALGHRERSGSEDHFLLQEMCVAPGRQRAGVGAALLEALGAAMPDVRHWFLLTARDSHAADFYAGMASARRAGSEFSSDPETSEPEPSDPESASVWAGQSDRPAARKARA